MCGIAGIVTAHPITANDIRIVQKMNNAMHHRGPDGSGEYHDSHIAFAMRRLSIIDLKGGWQPLYNEDQSLVLIANGEIYNYIELRSMLEASGHHFHSGSDCETIIHLYEDYGTDFVHHLRGMFAFALWDSNRQRLILVRDRLGEKPLYLYERQGQLFFASEMKSLLSSGSIPFELDPSSVSLYFHYQYVPEPSTPVRGVRKLDPGHMLTVDVKPWTIHEKCYWRFEDIPPLEGQPAELIRAEFDKVSELIVRADVPVGVALSGGLDSSAITALAARKYPDTMHAFCIGYPGRPKSDERTDAKALADYLGMPFHDIELSVSDMISFFPKLIFMRDDPIADISGYGYYAVMKLASEFNVPVMLQGQGGDELFWGYTWVKQAVQECLDKMMTLDEGWQSIFRYIHLEGPTSIFPRAMLRWAWSAFGITKGVKRFLRDILSPPGRMVFYDLVPDFSDAFNLDYFTASFKDRLKHDSPYDLFTREQPWERVDLILTELIYKTYLLENGITQGDRLSMASSIELRLPLLDYRFVETIVGLRKNQTDFMLPPKAWFKESLKGLLPEWVMIRPKSGFTPPVQLWYQALFASHGSMLDDGYLVRTGIIRPEHAKMFATGAVPKKDYVSPLSFKALVLESWCRQMSAICTSE
jgi:asparagine synthase (glutamine-hydrolysing)